MLHVFGGRSSIFVDTIGHAAGLVIFGLLIILLLRNWRYGEQPQKKLSLAVAGLVCLWNISELVVLAAGNQLTPVTHSAIDLSYCCLSLLPAVLLHIALGDRMRMLAWSGYILSAAAIVLAYAGAAKAPAEQSPPSLLTLSLGFALLSAGAWLWAEWQARRRQRAMRPNRVAFLSLFVFATSFFHFWPGHTAEVWIGEAIWHHAAIPIALIILLQDYRFLLLDVFLRFTLSAGWIAAWLWGMAWLNDQLHLWAGARNSDFRKALLLTSLVCLIYLLARSLRLMQLLLTKFVFRRRPVADLTYALQSSIASTEPLLLDNSAKEIASYYAAKSWLVLWNQADGLDSVKPVVVDPLRQREVPEAPWAAVILPLRFSKGDSCRIYLGSRAGGRRFLSEDLLGLESVRVALLERVERFRNEQMNQLVSQAELRALQAQINPHFLFNALNTLYGTIGRGSPQARQLVLNLADVFRARLQSNRSYVPLSEELDLVRAYLEIEALRLGDRLISETTVDDEDFSESLIPVLTIQPLIENAVRHGMSASGTAHVRLEIKQSVEGMRIAVRDKGRGFSSASDSNGMGLGLENVRKRLKLCYGEKARLEIESSSSGSAVWFVIPRA